MNVRPAIFSVPVLWVVPVFAAALKLTGPVPLPVPPLVIVIHDALLVAVHAQPVPVVTVVDPVPPAGAMVRLVGETVKLHDAP